MKGFNRLLTIGAGITMVGEAKNEIEAVYLTGKLHPDLILMYNIRSGMTASSPRASSINHRLKSKL